jgi:L-seryl-tRNA(Ser) seleniumtransferase
MTIAALDATLRMYLNGTERNIPSIAYLTRPIGDILRIAEVISAKLGMILNGIAKASVEEDSSQVGSGSLPVESIKSWYVVLQPINISVEELARLFRSGSVPVIGRIRDDKFIMDMRTIYGADIRYILETAETIKTQKEP